MHDDGKDVHAVIRYRGASTPGDAMSLRHYFRLPRRYDVTPVGVDSNAEYTRVVGAQLIGVEEPQTRAVGDEVVQHRVRVVRLEHVVARPGVRVQRVAGLRWIIEALRGGETEKRDTVHG